MNFDEAKINELIEREIAKQINKKLDGAIEREETIRDILLTKLKEEYDEDLELIEFETLTDKDYDIYKITY